MRKNRTTLAIEIICVLLFISLFMIHAITGQIRWLVIITPIVIIGIMRMFVVFLISIFNISNLYYWIKWKITGIEKKKVKKEKGKRKKGQGMRC